MLETDSVPLPMVTRHTWPAVYLFARRLKRTSLLFGMFDAAQTGSVGRCMQPWQFNCIHENIVMVCRWFPRAPDLTSKTADIYQVFLTLPSL